MKEVELNDVEEQIVNIIRDNDRCTLDVVSVLEIYLGTKKMKKEITALQNEVQQLKILKG